MQRIIPSQPIERKTALIGILFSVFCSIAQPEPAPVFQRTFAMDARDVVTVEADVYSGDITIEYNRDGQVSLYAVAHDPAGNNVTEKFLKASLTIEQLGNRIKIRQTPAVEYLNSAFAISYHINVPYRTQVNAIIRETGNQTVLGITGPVKVTTGGGNIRASYIPTDIEAATGRGTISCFRMGRVAAETGSGDISMSVVGTSRVTVKKGAGRIDVGGITGALIASTDRGELHVKGGLFSDWQLHSRFGNILIELPPNWKFEVDTATRSGLVSIERADMQKPDAETTAYREKVNGGGKYIRAESESGVITIR